MPIYILMTKLTSSGHADQRGRREAGRAWKQKVEALCPDIRWIAHYALLGPYDFMDVYEAEGDDTAFRVSMLSRAEGALTAESWPALEYENFLPLADAVEDAVSAPAPQRSAPRRRKTKRGSGR
jgi:uncharacterized protein with GYD domain